MNLHSHNPRHIHAVQDDELRRVVILDTWVNDTNLGNRIIMEAVVDELRELLPGSFFYHAPALEFIRAGRHLVDKAELIFLAGTNLLSNDMDKTSEWRLTRQDTSWLSRTILCGVGWWQYQQGGQNRFTRRMLAPLAHSAWLHSVRDSYTEAGLAQNGARAINTGCPTLWKLSPRHCAQIPVDKCDDVLITFTEYNRDPSLDRAMVRIVQRNYRNVFVWPQQVGDFAYARKLCDGDVTIIEPTLEALDHLLAGQAIDYVGTRLHAGVRALQHQRRSIIIAIDNRATEMGRDFNLPVLARDRIESELEDRIKAAWLTEVDVDYAAINAWRGQFIQTQTLAETNDDKHAHKLAA